MTVSPVESAAESGRPRRRWPRRLARMALWSVAGLAVITAGLWLVLQTDWAREEARRRVVERLAEALGRDVAIEALDFSLLPPAVGASRLAIGGPQGLDTPLATVEELTVRFGPGVLRGLRGKEPLVLSEIVVVEPRVAVVFNQDGTSNLPDLPEKEGDGGGLEVRIHALHLRDGELRLEELAVPLDLTAEGFAGALREVGEGELLVRADSEHLELRYLDESPFAGSLSLQALVTGGAVEIQSGRLRSELLSADFGGDYRDERLRLAGSIDADAALLEARGWTDQISGSVRVEAELESAAEEWTLDARLSSPRLTVASGSVGRVEATVGVRGGGGEVEFPSVRLRSDHLSADVGGSYRDELLRLEGSISADAALLEALGWTDQIGGSVDVEATLESRAGDWTLDARVASSRLTLADQPLAQLTARVRGSAGAVVADIERAVLATGSLRGSVEYRWGGGADEVYVDLGVRAADLATVLALVNAPVVGPVGRVDADFGYRFAPNAPVAGRGHAELRLVPPKMARSQEEGSVAGQLPLGGSLSIVVADGVLTVENGRLTGPDQEIDLGGTIALADAAADFRFDLETSDPRAILRTLPAIYENDASPLWELSRGRGSVLGRLRIDQGFRVDLELDLRAAEVGDVQVAHASGGLTIDDDGIHDLDLVLERGSSSLAVRGTVPFEGPDPGSVSPSFTLAVETRSWPLADVAPWLPFELPFEGLASGRLDLWGDVAAMSGRLDASVAEISVGGMEVEGDLAGVIGFDPESVAIGPLRLTSAAGEVELEGSLDLLTEGLDLRLTSSLLDLAAPPFEDWFAGLLQGVAEIEVEIGGTLSGPSARGHLAGSGLALDGRLLGDEGSARADLVWGDGDLRLEGSLLGLVDFSGGGRLDAAGSDVSVALVSEELEKILYLALGQAPTGLEGRLAGVLEIRGAGEERTVQVRFDDLALSYLDRRITAIEPVVIAMGPKGPRVESLWMREEGTGSEIIVYGDLDSPGKGLDLAIESAIDVSWLNLYLTGLEISGAAELLVVVRGSPSEPQIDGQARLVDGRLIVADFPHAVERVNGLLLLYPNQIVMDSGAALFAGGKLAAEGTIAFAEGGSWGYELRLQGTDLDLRYPEDWRLRGNAQLTVSSTPNGRQLGGTVTLEQASFAKDFKLGFTQLIRTVLQRRREFVEETDELLVATRLNIAVEGPGALSVQTNLAKLGGDLDFTVRGNLAAPVILGDIGLTRGGEVGIGGAQYKIERGLLTFANPYRNDPQVDLVASAKVKSYDIRLSLFGPIDRLETSFSSTPAAADLDIVSMLTTGSADLLGSVGGKSVTDSSAAEAFLAGQAASLAGKRVGTLLGLDQVQISPLGGGSTDLSAARITVGRRISRDVFVTYSYDPSESQESIYEIAWQIYPSIALILTSSDEGSYAVDMRWDKTF